MATQKVQQIIDGPSKWDFALSLFEKGKVVQFTVEGPEILHVVVRGIEMEDGSRENWLLKGFVVSEHAGRVLEDFEAYYNTRNRSGARTLPR